MAVLAGPGLQCITSHTFKTLQTLPFVSARFSTPGQVFGRISRNTVLSRSLAPRSFSTSRTYPKVLTAIFFGSIRLNGSRRHGSLPQSQSRHASTGNISQSTLAHMEQTANNNPSSASSQVSFYSTLLRANMPEILVERYETGRYATNPACDAMYYRALERMGQGQSGGTVLSATAGRGAFSQDQLQAVTRAVAASQRGGNTATPLTKTGAETGDKSSPLHVVVNDSKGMTFFKVARFLMIYMAVGYFTLVVITWGIESTTGLLGRRGPGGHNAEVKAEDQKARFADVQGCDEAKEELQEIVDFLRSPEKYNQLGGKLPKGVLMIGPPGTGKTLLARAVAGEAGVPFFYMSGSEFDEVYVGVGAKRVRELFANAKAKAPAIIFIDELDAVGGKRNERDAAYHMQTLNQMLTELDGFDQTSGVVLIAATNFPQMLDKALTRPGRFDKQIHVPLPDVRGRMAILDHYMKNMQIGTEVDSTAIARGTPGFSGADLENLVNQAAVHASKINAKKIGMLDLEWAKDRILMGAEKRSLVIQEKDKIMTAYHEAGHALMAMFSEGSDPVYKCTIVPRGNALGITYRLPELDKVSIDKMECLAHIDVMMGGKVAEEIVYGPEKTTSGCASDLSSATQLAYNMVVQYGMSETLGAVAFGGNLYERLSSQTKQKIENEVRRLLNEGQERARTMLNLKRKELDLLAQALIKYETLDKDEIEKIVKGEKLPDKLTVLPGPMKLPDIPLPSSLGTAGGFGGSDESGPEIPEPGGAET